MDVDGTLTDGKLHISAQGECFKSFNVKDGYALAELLPAMGITPVIVTGRSSKIVEHRCEELNITHIYQGVNSKLSVMHELAKKMSFSLCRNFAYIGDDINDIEIMEAVAICACPADASEGVLRISDIVLKSEGGNGAVREFVEWLAAWHE